MTTTLAELKTKADNLGIDRGIVRIYGDLRKISTWERAIASHQTVTVEAVEIADTVADEIDKSEIIPFIPEIDLAECNDRKSTMLFEVQRQRAIFKKKPEAIANLPPAPPPIIINVPEERRDIPGIEIAENDSPSPGIGRGDERFRNMGDRLGEKIKVDIFKYLDSIHTWMFNQFADQNTLSQYEYFDAWYQIEKFQSIHRPEKIKVYEFIEKAIALVAKIKKEHIPWYLQPDMPAPPVWCVTEKDDYFLLLERPGPIPTLSCDYGGEFIPNRYHELGINIYCWKFPNQLRAEEFFEMIERATQYQFIPASQPQLLLAGV